VPAAVVRIPHCTRVEVRLAIERDRRKSSAKRKSENGILSARPCANPAHISSGIHNLSLGSERDGLLIVPDAGSPALKRPLIVSLHGAGGNAHDATQPFRRLADTTGFIILAPDARSDAWDAMENGWGPDVDFIDTALHWVFDSCAIDQSRIALAGFSDGASYALSLGIANGDLFSHIIAFSPGFLRAPARRGKPKIFVSHGSSDALLPSVRCSQRIVAQLTQDGYDVRFEHFDGGHLVPASVANTAVKWLMA
jgi:phospholipase/carboxylesterase